jgi:hypothetical protein
MRVRAMKELADAGIQVGMGLPHGSRPTTAIFLGCYSARNPAARPRPSSTCCGCPAALRPYFEQRLREKLRPRLDRGPERIREGAAESSIHSKFGERMRGKGQYWAAAGKTLQTFTPSGSDSMSIASAATIILIATPSVVLPLRFVVWLTTASNGIDISSGLRAGENHAP